MDGMSDTALIFGLIYLAMGLVVFCAIVSMAIDAWRMLGRASRLAELMGTTNRLLQAQSGELREGFKAQQKALGLLVEELRALRAPVFPAETAPGAAVSEISAPCWIVTLPGEDQ